ncbi:MAG: transcription-repair coupling factor [Candidatus Eisenbacteria bacterium]|nr:transcription-repair coupling factor [Candidatus Eisenbacteria bacterium]
MPSAPDIRDSSVAATLLERFSRWPSFQKARDEVRAAMAAAARPGGDGRAADGRAGASTIRLHGLTGSARSLAIALLASDSEKPILFLASESAIAEEVREDVDFLLGPRSAVLYPASDGSPYASAPGRGAARVIRTELLSVLATGMRGEELPLYRNLRVVVTTPPAWIRKVPAPEWLARRVRVVRVGQPIDPEDLVRELIEAGYEISPMVGEYGDASRRGGILDIFSLGRENPVRCEFDGDEIVSLREFDAFTQRSVRTLGSAAILPVSAILPSGEERAAAAEAVTEAGGDPSLAEVIRESADYEGAEWIAGLYGIPMVPLRAYLGAAPCIVRDDPAALEGAIARWRDEVVESYEAAAGEGKIISAPEELYRLDDSIQLDDSIAGGSEIRIDLGGFRGGDGAVHELPTKPAERFGRSLELTRSYILRLAQTCPEIHILCDTDLHRDRLAELLYPVPALLEVGNLAAGFEAPDIGLAVLTDHEIFARSRRRSASRRFTQGISLKELLAMSPGDFVVHVEHGIGVYRGLTRLLVDGQETDCMTLEYAGGDRLYIPADQLSLVQRYSAEEGHRPSLSRLGSPSWARTKAKIKKRIRDMAEELLKTYAIRRSRPGHPFSADTDAQSALELSFPYEETPDQLKAIGEVKADMERPNPMDRLICGDVGYGKTEVAIRAAFKAVMDGKQVAVLVPTTLLAQQHFDTFRERLRDFPVRVELLSRFRSPAEQKEVLKELKAGKVDVVVGTHRLVQKDVAFRDLGLLVIDEEHRFGVAHKERLKKIKETVDVLTLTATPIPRTLHFALSGGRDMSTILTPPRDRRPIQTEVAEFREEIVAHALMREADRGGQSFFVHNRIESIDAMASYLGRLVPHLRIAVAHGEMRETHLERVMRAFFDREYDVLLSTTIIESGLDFPNVNTILIDRGDTFGLAQLYQLRGRVGRSDRKAYAYLLVPPYRSITETAQKRLKAIEEFGDLGSGFQLAMRDLEIRGAGNLLGAEQHGFILNVGFDLYCKLLDETVRELKGIPGDQKREARIVTDVEAYFPDDYVSDSREKMTLYKSIADTRDLDELARIEEEIRDRFGMLPEPGRQLLDLRRLRLLASEAGIETATVKRDQVVFEFHRPLTKGDIQRLAEAPASLEFLTPAHGRHRIRCRKPGPAGPVAIGLAILRSLLQREIPLPQGR